MQLTPAADAIYAALLDSVGTFGDVRVEEKQASVHLAHRVAFAGVRPLSSRIVLTIVSVDPISSPRVDRSERVSRNRVHNELRLASPDQIDAELVGWLRTAYDLMA